LFDRLLDARFRECAHTELAGKSVILGVITSIFLIALKFGAWQMTDSISMRASMNDSILDALTSFIAYHALLFSSVSFDRNHNYGHEKVEGLIALFQCLLVIYSGVMIFVEAYEVFIEPKSITNENIGIAVMVISCFAVYQLVYFQKYTARKTDSVLVKGDSLHYLSDFLMNICIIVSMLISRFFAYMDVICGAIVGGYVLYSAFQILRSAIIDLMDEALPANMREKILHVIKSVDGVKRIQMLKTRSAGMKKYVEAVVMVDPHISFIQATKISQTAETELQKVVEKIDAIVKVMPDED
jgi:ferrous-iron efflux pump FieF